MPVPVWRARRAWNRGSERSKAERHLFPSRKKTKRKPRRPVALFSFSFLSLNPDNSSLRNSFPLQALLQLEYPDKLQRLLLTPQREVLVELVITRDNGEIEVC